MVLASHTVNEVSRKPCRRDRNYQGVKLAEHHNEKIHLDLEKIQTLTAFSSCLLQTRSSICRSLFTRDTSSASGVLEAIPEKENRIND